jgi:hypothetical protein
MNKNEQGLNLRNLCIKLYVGSQYEMVRLSCGLPSRKSYKKGIPKMLVAPIQAKCTSNISD